MRIGCYQKKDIRNNVSYFLQNNAVLFPQKVAFYYFSIKGKCFKDEKAKEINFEEFENRVGSFANGLENHRIGRGDKVLIFLPISVELYVAIIGLQRIGAIPVLVDSLSRKDQLINIIQNAKPSGVIAFAEWFSAIEKEKSLAEIELKISVGEKTYKKNVIKFEGLYDRKNKDVVAVEKQETALITYTTGSSGEPKGVDRTHGFLSLQHYALKRLFPYKRNDIDLPVFPVFALNNIASGISTVIPKWDISEYNADKVIDIIYQIKECRVNCMTLSPSSFRNLAKHCNEHKRLLKGITRVLTGGAPISKTDILNFQRIAPFSKNWILYGSTEVEPISFIESKQMVKIKYPKWKNITTTGVNVGKIDKMLKWKLIDIDFKKMSTRVKMKELEVEEGEVGELIVSGEHVCDRYFNNKAAFHRTKIVDSEGVIWHQTGDVGRMDEEDFLWIVGRKHNVIKHENEYYYPVRPEIMLKDLPGITNAAYLQLSRKNIVAVVTLSNSKDFNRDIRKNIRDLFKGESLPLDDIILMEKIPMDVRHHSKVDYKKLYKILDEFPE